MAPLPDLPLAELLMHLLNRVVEVLKQMLPLLPTYSHLIASAVFPIYAASHASLIRPSSAAKSKSEAAAEGAEEKSEVIESLTPADAVLFPLLAGGTLASLYFILKWLQDPHWLNTILSIYFSWIGVFFAFKFLRDVFTNMRSFVFPNTYSTARGQLVWTADPNKRAYTTVSGLKTNSPLPGMLRHLSLGRRLSSWIWKMRSLLSAPAALHLRIGRLLTVDSTITLIDPVALLISCAIVAFHAFIAKPWYLTNFLGFSFCYGALQFTTPTTGWTGTLVLGALFFYDIYFVFFTPMMVTVATKLDVPIKLLFPQPNGCVLPPSGSAGDSAAMQAYRECVAKKRAMAMLGLGDIVVPGMMIAFALRFDLFLHYYQHAGKSSLGAGSSSSSSNSSNEQTGTETETTKVEYKSATGAWGERFWTKKTAWSEHLHAKSFRKRYFHATLVGYVAGLVVTLVALQVMQHGQPALLYLVPGVVGMFWGTALVSGEFKTLWNYSEAEEDAEGHSKEDDEEEKKKKKKKAKLEDEKGEKKGKAAADSKDQDLKLVDFSITLLPPTGTGTNTATATATTTTTTTTSAADNLRASSSSAERAEAAVDQDGVVTKRRRLVAVDAD